MTASEFETIVAVVSVIGFIWVFVAACWPVKVSGESQKQLQGMLADIPLHLQSILAPDSFYFAAVFKFQDNEKYIMFSRDDDNGATVWLTFPMTDDWQIALRSRLLALCEEYDLETETDVIGGDEILQIKLPGKFSDVGHAGLEIAQKLFDVPKNQPIQITLD